MAERRARARRWPFRWLRFNLRSFFVLVVVCGAIVGGVANVKRRADLERQAIDRLQEMGATVVSERQLPQWLKSDSDKPPWNWFDRAVEVRFAVDFPFDTTPPKTSPLDYQKYNEALASLRSLPKLRSLHLFGCPTSDESLVHIGRLSRLESLNLAYAPISDEGARQLSRLTRLQSLDVSNTDISDETAALFGGLHELRTLNLSETRVSTAAVRELSRRIPQASIDIQWVLLFRNVNEETVVLSDHLTVVFEDQGGNLGGMALTAPVAGSAADQNEFATEHFKAGFKYADGVINVYVADRSFELHDIGQKLVAGGVTIPLAGNEPIVRIDAGGTPRLEVGGEALTTTAAVAILPARGDATPRLPSQVGIWATRTLLALAGCGIAICLWSAVRVRRAANERRLLAAIGRIPGASILYDYWLRGKKHPRGPDWLKQQLSPEYFQRVGGLMLDYNKWVNDAELARLCDSMRHARVRSLNLDNTAITDASVESLARVRSLRELRLRGTQITEAGIQKLRAALPKANVTA